MDGYHFIRYMPSEPSRFSVFLYNTNTNFIFRLVLFIYPIEGTIFITVFWCHMPPIFWVISGKAYILTCPPTLQTNKRSSNNSKRLMLTFGWSVVVLICRRGFISKVMRLMERIADSVWAWFQVSTRAIGTSLSYVYRTWKTVDSI